MTYKRFEDLPVWQAAIALALSVYELVDHREFGREGDLRSQLQRASLSISNNIGEGFERGTTPELLTFLYIARGSAGETRSALRFARLRPTLAAYVHQIDALISKAESISKQLWGWMESLKDSDIEGTRRLNEQTRQEYVQGKKTVEFLRKLQDIRDRASGATNKEPRLTDAET